MGNSLKEKTSKRIKELRLSRNYTMEKLAELIGVAKSTIAKWENGYVDNMRQERIIRLAEIFNVSPTYIMGYDDESEIDEETKAKLRDEQFMKEYSRLDASQQELVNNMIEAFLSKK